MKTTYKPYPAYKDSGVEWLGEIPEGWDLWKIIHASSHIGSGTTPKSDNGEYYGGRFLWVTTGELRENTIFDTKKKVNALALSKVPSLKIHPTGSVVIAMYGATIGRLGILGKQATTNQACCVIPPSKTIHNKYLFYWLYAMKQEIINMSSGGGQPNINQEKVAGLKVSAPHCNEQIQIANFLDHETARIDTLIAKQKKLIALLKEKRQAVISHAVTKGLNPNVEMKDSGVEWLGEVPAHWEVKRLKYIGKAIIGLTYSPDDVVDEKEGTLVLRSSNIQNKNLAFKDNVFVNKSIPEKLKTKLGDILICSRNGSRNLIGKNAIIDESAEGITFGAFMTVFRSEYNKYLFQVFNSSLFDYQSGTFLTSTVNQLTTGNLNSFEVPFPSDKEKKEISHYLEFETTRIDGLIEKAKEAIMLMQERRTALISAAVTGKIDLRDWQAPQEQSAKVLVGQDA